MLVVESLSKVEVIEGKKYKYLYKLVKSDFPAVINKKNFYVDCYGIEIERQDIIDNNVVNFERDSIYNISTYRHKVHSLLKLLYDNTVSPIHMVDVIGNYVDDCVFDFNEQLQQISMG